MENHSDTEPLILFDVGGVLVKLNFLNLGRKAQELSGGRLKPEEFLKLYSETGLEKNYVLGNISTDEFLRSLERIIGNNVSVPELKKLAVSHLDGVVSDMVGLKVALQERGYRVGIFSNTAPLHVEILSRENPYMYSNADPLILSFQRHLAKPDRRMYELVGIHPNVIFIDDSQVYVNRGIEEFGWRGIVYEGSIDPSEPQRKRDEVAVQRNDSMRIAKSSEEVADYLREFGVFLR